MMRKCLPVRFRPAAFLLSAAVLMFFGLSVGLAQQNSTDQLVTSRIIDYIDVTDPVTGTMQRLPMQVQSDGAGAYNTVPYKRSYSVKSVIQSIGDWELDTGIYVTSPTRKVFLDFSRPIAGSGPNGNNPTPPFITGLMEARFISKCHEYGINTLTVTGGQTVTCPLVIGFYYPIGSSDHYRIHMTPDSRSQFSYPETDNLNITCTGVDANLNCNQWRMEPNGIKGGCVTADCSVKQNVIKLIKEVTVKGKSTEINLGDFYISFSISVTNP